MKELRADALIEVAFYDLDPMDIVWHGNYIKYFELARCALLDKIGYGYAQMRESGFSWPVIDLQVRYVKPAILGQKLICSAQLVDYENRLKISYEIVCANTGVRLTKGHSVQVAVDHSTQEMQLISPRIMQERVKVAYEQV